MSVTVKDVDHGFKKLLENAHAAAKGSGVSVGIHAKEGDVQHKPEPGKKPEPVTVLDVAIWNEFGLGVPERSFLRAWVDQNPGPNADALRRATMMILKGERTVAEAMELVGLKLAGNMQKAIAENSLGLKENAASTIARKGSSKPLEDIGQMRQSITHMVRSKP